METRYDDVKVPALMNSAWYDIFQVGFVPELRRDAEARAGRRRLRRGGPRSSSARYGHAGDEREHPTFGTDPSAHSLGRLTQLRFFNRYLKGMRERRTRTIPNVTLYVLVPFRTRGKTGSGFTVTGDTYPLPGTLKLRLFLSSGGNANSSKGRWGAGLGRAAGTRAPEAGSL